MNRSSRVASALLVIAMLAACGGGGPRAATTTTTTASTTSTTTTSSVTTTSTTTSTTTTTSAPATAQTTTTAAPDNFASSIEHVTAAELGASWHDGCPVAPEDLRLVTVSLVGFNDEEHTGQVVVNASHASKVVDAFHRIYRARFPVRKMKPIFTQAEFDDFETPDDNSTGYSCRNAVNDSGAQNWSNHAFGYAIDINPIENPYIEGDRIIPSAGAAYTDRDNVRPGMATSDSAVVKAFRAIGWGWGASFEDYQHFSTDGR